MLVAGLAHVQFHRHSANWIIGRHTLNRSGSVAMMMVAVIVWSFLVHGFIPTSRFR
jgi:hypothetical protein